MITCKSILEIKNHIHQFKAEGKKIGLVPTMGALHLGHISLIEAAKKNNDIVIATIFVNPTQFNNPDDLLKYPRTLNSDLEKLATANCDLVFTPEINEIYGNNLTPQVYNFEGLDEEMEGKFRANHFNGVGTIVEKLFKITTPNNAYFGEKDFQQLLIIKKLTEIKNIPVHIIGCPIFREPDGLAMSSRNTRLTAAHRNAAPFIYKTLITAKNHLQQLSIKEVEAWVKNQFQSQTNLTLEYYVIANENDLKPASTLNPTQKYRSFIAVFAGDIRLIDNLAIQ